ncbi:uncharacterized protein [Typha latifolia]|uniref:uncharacterized protein n=1 Tax=Typha latifolia TaxID=4733 RepID=UPI003C2F305A
MERDRSIPHLLILTLLSFALQLSTASDTIVVDSLAEWRNPIFYVGDTIVFKNGHLQNLYLFHNERAFDRCNFAQATLLYEGKSMPTHFTWHPTLAGYYHLSTKDTSRSCENGEKVTLLAINPELLLGFSPLTAPPPTSGGKLPFVPSSAPLSFYPATGPTPSAAPSWDSNGDMTITSNPAIPLPTGTSDTATILPLLYPDGDNQAMGVGSSVEVAMSLLGFVMMFSLEIVIEELLLYLGTCVTAMC